MTNVEIRKLWYKFGGEFFGHNDEHANIKEEALYEFARALLTHRIPQPKNPVELKND